ncbi:LPS-assembly protein LptD, partial [Aliarcobacter butzleri]|nr:LPS-assembly protein LptD [Aliarcobacter butzleri]
DTSRDATTKEMVSNNETLQELPQVHLHSYNKELLDNLVYSMDAKYMNYTRPRGLTANVYEFNVPISYTKYFADDFLYLTLENKTIINEYEYGNYKKGFKYLNGSSSYKYEDGTLIQNRSSILLGSDLIKPYNDYLHTMNLSAEYVIPKNLKEDGDLYGITVEKQNDEARYNELSIFPTLKDQKYVNLSLNQSLYDKENLKQFINHKMTQAILYD